MSSCFRAANGEELEAAIFGIAANGRNGFAAVEAGHPHIEQDDIRSMLGEPDHGLQAVFGGVDFESAHAQAAGEQLAFVVVIFDD